MLPTSAPGGHFCGTSLCCCPCQGPQHATKILMQRTVSCFSKDRILSFRWDKVNHYLMFPTKGRSTPGFQGIISLARMGATPLGREENEGGSLPSYYLISYNAFDFYCIQGGTVPSPRGALRVDEHPCKSGTAKPTFWCLTNRVWRCERRDRSTVCIPPLGLNVLV